MTKYKKNQITLQIRCSISMAKNILNRLYGNGTINRSQYQYKLSKIDKKAAELEQKKAKKTEILLKKVFTTKKSVL